eukprot:6264902-Prorocentrum_lima.AAC.1
MTSGCGQRPREASGCRWRRCRGWMRRPCAPTSPGRPAPCEAGEAALNSSLWGRGVAPKRGA